MMKKSWIVGVLCAFALSLTLPALTEDKAADKGKEKIAAELKAMKERKAQTNCPLSGHPIAEGKGYDYLGYHIGTCCDDCAKAVEKDPLTAILKIREKGEEPQLAEGFKLQDRCPMSGKPIVADVYAIKNNQLVTFCCPGCPAGYLEKPEEIMGKLIESKQAPILITMAQTTCPLSGEPVTEGINATHDGKVVGFCCANCKAAFEKDPEKVIQSLRDQGYVLENAKE